jgi:hypothetical protein
MLSWRAWRSWRNEQTNVLIKEECILKNKNKLYSYKKLFLFYNGCQKTFKPHPVFMCITLLLHLPTTLNCWIMEEVFALSLWLKLLCRKFKYADDKYLLGNCRGLKPGSSKALFIAIQKLSSSSVSSKWVHVTLLNSYCNLRRVFFGYLLFHKISINCFSRCYFLTNPKKLRP